MTGSERSLKIAQDFDIFHHTNGSATSFDILFTTEKNLKISLKRLKKIKIDAAFIQEKTIDKTDNTIIFKTVDEFMNYFNGPIDQEVIKKM
ncbi:MAG: hypothetical protein MHPSP_004828 [Paramarteilia canceri]